MPLGVIISNLIEKHRRSMVQPPTSYASYILITALPGMWVTWPSRCGMAWDPKGMKTSLGNQVIGKKHVSNNIK